MFIISAVCFMSVIFLNDTGSGGGVFASDCVVVLRNIYLL